MRAKLLILRKPGVVWTAAVLLAALSARAADVVVEPLPSAPPAPVLSGSAASGVAAPELLAPPFSAPILSAAPALAPMAAQAVVAAPVSAPVPAAALAAFAAPANEPLAAHPSAPGAARRVALSAPALAAAPSAGNVQFDGAVSAPAAEPAGPSDAALIRAHAARPLRGAFIQQEQEGSLLAPDRRDSSGNVFRYYSPFEMRPDLVAQVEGGLSRFDKVLYATRRFLQFGRGGAEAAWKAWPLSAKLAYLDALERAVSVERGPAAAWDGKVSLILTKTAAAPDYVAVHPHMEPPPDAHRGAVGARFLQPEIVSGKSFPAATVDQALARTRGIIAETGHAGTQYHVFLKADPDALLAQMDSIDGTMQILNDALFARAISNVANVEANLSHPSLRPWHRGRGERVRALLESRDPNPHVPAADDEDSEKHAFVGLRYWGMEGGKAVVSFELRGVSIPWKRAPQRAVGGLESPSAPERNYDEARQYLTFAALYAEALARGEAPAARQKSVELDESAADAYLAARAKALGMPDGAFDGLAAFARRLSGASAVPQGWLFPFSAGPEDSPRVRALADELVVLAAQSKALEDSGRNADDQHMRFRTWSAYSDWAGRYAAEQEMRLRALVRAAAR